MAIANNLEFSSIPDDLPVLTNHEWRVLSPRIVFMKIHQLPVGQQLSIHGNIVNVPADVLTSVNMLPRCSSQSETVALQFKRRSKYKHAFMSANIRPACIREVATFLVQQGSLFKQECISFSEELLETVAAEQLQLHESAHSGRDQVENSTINIEMGINEHVNDEDHWDETDNTNNEQPGIFDTLFTSPDFVEDTERSAVYTFCPAERNRPLSIFMDTYSEELAFPNIFMGSSRPENHEVKIQYSEIVKSELRRSDRRVARCVDNIFFKLKKVQMQAVTGQVNVAVRKRKTGGKIMTAGQLRDQGGIENLIQHDNGYRILKQLRGSPPYWEAAQKDLMAMIRQLGPATLFVTLSAAETRWLHLLKLLAQINDNKEFTDEQCQQLSWGEKCRLISADPVTCARHFQYSVNLFLNTF
jgi:hypothetical protein